MIIININLKIKPIDISLKNFLFMLNRLNNSILNVRQFKFSKTNIINYHNYFNLIIMMVLNYNNLLNWGFDTNNYLIWQGKNFNTLLYLSILYLILDIFLIIKFPFVSKNRKTVLYNHIASLFTFYIIRISGPSNYWLISYAMLAEINTFFLILNRIFLNNPTKLISKLMKCVISLSFYTSWIMIRLILFPYFLVFYFKIYYSSYIVSKKFLNINLIFIIIGSIFTFLNFYWTFNLLTKVLLKNKDNKILNMSLDSNILNSLFNKQNIFREIISYDSKLIHDYFNIVYLPIIIFLNITNWEILSNLNNTYSIVWNGSYFNYFWITTMIYFIIDFIWIYLIPNCVKNSNALLIHHIVTIINLLFQYFLIDNVEWITSTCLIVEINTWFLILRRLDFQINNNLVRIIMKYYINFMFFFSWILIRLFLYPYLVYYIFISYEYYYQLLSFQYHNYSPSFFLVLNPVLFPLVGHLLLCTMNFKWSYELIKNNLFNLSKKYL